MHSPNLYSRFLTFNLKTFSLSQTLTLEPLLKKSENKILSSNVSDFASLCFDESTRRVLVAYPRFKPGAGGVLTSATLTIERMLEGSVRSFKVVPETPDGKQSTGITCAVPLEPQTGGARPFTLEFSQKRKYILNSANALRLNVCF